MNYPKHVWRFAGTCILAACLAPLGWADAQQMPTAVAIAGLGDVTDPLSESYLESSGAVIRHIQIDNRNIFNPDNTEESGAFYRIVNRLHIRTREQVIRDQLLTQAGDAYSASEIAETERMLRAHRYLNTAEIVPVRYDDGAVDLAVKTSDTWSLMPSIRFSRSGGRNNTGIKFKESNLLGRGTEVELGYMSEFERDSAEFHYRDAQLGSSRYRFAAGIFDNSDGSAFDFALEQPFYALDARRAQGLRVNGFDQIDSGYELGELSNQVRHKANRAELYRGWSSGLQDGWVRRFTVGLAYDEHVYSGAPAFPLADDTPADRKDIYPFIGVEWHEDRYETVRNADNIVRLEDRHMGASYAVRAGFAAGALGSSDDALLLNMSASRGYHPLPDTTLLLSADAEARFTESTADSYLLQTAARFYYRQSEKRLFYARLQGDASGQIDTDRRLVLGGDTGLRGYPLSYQAGDRRARLTFEQRYYTDWYPFRLFHVGGAAFFDAGRSWGVAQSAEQELGLLRDVGLGLRIGSPHSSTGRMLHIDLAFPLDGPPDMRGAQLVIETYTAF